MRVLWISPNGGNYKADDVKGTGGWIGALQTELTSSFPELELGIAFSGKSQKVVKEGNVTYFSVTTTNGNKFKKAINFLILTRDKRTAKMAHNIKDVIDQYAPDVVHFWGIEGKLANAIPLTDCPFVVHIQGLLSLYQYMYLPYGFSKHDLKCFDPWWNPTTWKKMLFGATQYQAYKSFIRNANTEKELAKYVKNWIGRTEWDYMASKMLSPNSNYYHCDELMRGNFSESKWSYHYNGKTVHIHSSIGTPWYKGIDVILKTAKLLKEQGVSIEWNVYGLTINDAIVRYFIKRLDIKPSENGIHFRGRVDGQQICKGLLSCDVYVHPSYIENSSNAMAEAMMLGTPTIAQYVGGNSTMLKDESGLLVPPGAPYDLAYAINRMCDKETAERYSENALKVAGQRQNTNIIVSDLMNIYRKVINSK